VAFLDPLLQQASQMDPRVASLARNPFSDLPRFSYAFNSEANPSLNGAVELRYPTMGDMLAIESMAQRGRPYSEVLATLQVLVEKAPASWLHRAPGERTPAVSLSRMPYDAEFFSLYRGFTDWRDSFRGGDQSSHDGSSE
jgi:hypothetical protein